MLALWPVWKLSTSHCVSYYLFIFRSEARPVLLVESHHDSHHIFAVHNGNSQDVLGLILGQFIHKVAEMRTLGREKRVVLIVFHCLIFALTILQELPDSVQVNTLLLLRFAASERLSIICKLEAVPAALRLLLLLSSRGHQLRSSGGETVKERLINCQEGTKTCRKRPAGNQRR